MCVMKAETMSQHNSHQQVAFCVQGITTVLLFSEFLSRSLSLIIRDEIIDY